MPADCSPGLVFTTLGDVYEKSGFIFMYVPEIAGTGVTPVSSSSPTPYAFFSNTLAYVQDVTAPEVSLLTMYLSPFSTFAAFSPSRRK